MDGAHMVIPITRVERCGNRPNVPDDLQASLREQRRGSQALCNDRQAEDVVFSWRSLARPVHDACDERRSRAATLALQIHHDEAGPTG